LQQPLLLLWRMMHCVGVEFKKQENYGYVQALESLLRDEVFYQGNNGMLLLLLLLCYYSLGTSLSSKVII
jgi:hypothetical protein